MSRKDLTAGAAVFLVLVQLLFAQLTIAIAGCLLLTGRAGRWRLAWLALPAAGGIAWMLADGVRPSLAGYLAGGGHLVAHLVRPQARAIGLARLRGALAGWRGWLSAQLPLAVPVASAQAALIELAGRRDGRVQPRPGVLAGIGRAYLAWSTGRGELATADGGCVGICVSTGRRAAISWQEAAGGVLCTGQDAASVTATGLTLTLAAIAHRKAVLAIDLASGAPEAGGAGPVDAIESACADVSAPLRRFGGPHGCYDPLAGSTWDPASGPGAEEYGAGEYGAGRGRAGERGAGEYGAGRARTGESASGRHVLAMIDWAGVGDERRRFCADVVNAALTVITTSAAGRPGRPGRPGSSVLDELLALLQPGALGARVRESPGEFGAVIELADRLDAWPEAVAPVTAQLEALRGGSLGRWLRRASGDSRISLRRALADREVVLFSLDAARNGWSAAMIARLALADVTAILAELAELGEPTDCLVWVNGCEFVTSGQLRALIGVGESAGAAVLLGTVADSAAARLASKVNVVAVRGHAPPSLLGDEQASSGQAGEAAGWGQLAAGHHRDALSLLVRGPRSRVLASCRAVR